MNQLTCPVSEFTLMHDAFLNEWNQALISGDTSRLNRMTEEYYVAFFREATDQPMIFTKEESMNGLNESVKHFKGCQKRFENRVIRFRSEENAVVFYEQLVLKNDRVLARLFTIENWELIKGKWMIVRETEEAIH